VEQLVLVGSRHYNVFGSHGSDNYVDISHFDTLAEATKHLREEKKCKIVGIEIVEGALPIDSHPFDDSNVAFLLGNEGDGLSEKQMSLCDSFVYIPQYGSGTASLNVAVAASIVLHHYATWAGFKEREREGFKFRVATRQNRQTKRGIAGGRVKASGDEEAPDDVCYDIFGEGDEEEAEEGKQEPGAGEQHKTTQTDTATQTD
jgi:tRNA C32,U32 (ribose-2'-O)-methylase TrmJ